MGIIKSSTVEFLKNLYKKDIFLVGAVYSLLSVKADWVRTLPGFIPKTFYIFFKNFPLAFGKVIYTVFYHLRDCLNDIYIISEYIKISENLTILSNP